MVDLHFPLLVSVLQSQLYVLAQGLRFLLGQRCHDGDKYLSLGLHCVDGLLLKLNRNVHILKLADIF